MKFEELALNSLTEKSTRFDNLSPEGKCMKKLRRFYISYIKIERENEEQQLKETLRGLCSYIVFIVLLCIDVFASYSPYKYYYNAIMSHLFLDFKSNISMSFKDIYEVSHFWDVVSGPVIDTVYWDKWYNDEDLKNSNLSGYILYQNVLLKDPEIRQLKVNSSDCLVNTEAKEFVKECFTEYSVQSEDTSAFGPGIRDPNSTAWNYHTQEENNEFWFWGQVSSYSGAGFVKKLTMSRREAERSIAELRAREWIRRGSRVVFISFTVYNANINCICVIRLVVEFPATGGAMPAWSFITVPMDRSYFNTSKLIVKILFTLYIFLFMAEEILQVSIEGLEYFKEFWNVFDNLLIISCLSSLGLGLYHELNINSQADEIANGKANFNYMAFEEEMVQNVTAVIVFIAMIKVFKYISFNKTMAQLSLTLSSCAKDLMGFFIMFFIVFLAFTQLGYLFFGSQTPEFSTFMTSFFTLFRIILGDFNFHQLEQANRLLGPIYFMLFVFFVFFVLINMFLAIINDTYSEVKSDMAKQTELIVMSDYIKQNALAMIKRFQGSKNKRGDGDIGAEKDGYRKQVSVEEWKIELLSKGFEMASINSVLLKYGVDEQGYIDSAGQQLLIDELERQQEARMQYLEQTEEEDDISFEQEKSEEDEYKLKSNLKYPDYVNLFRRVARLESTLRSLHLKANALLTLFSQKSQN